ncbi:hypothetical protein QAD02_001762 [Eretmocerus hayati]|uniref:Uncharacterized protein n=1 Tax=Eretmocerus hayati TaxID=131215 RepID=A0ACC2NI63_9HYME|nr:hypothetical protein QAD02_001762 [Eretmocerus hayati]
MPAPKAPPKKQKVTCSAISEGTESHVIRDEALQLKGAKTFIEDNKQRFPLDFDQVVDFLQACYHKSNIPGIAADYVKDTAALVTMLTEISVLADKNLKHRIERIRKRINSTQGDDNDSVVSDSSLKFRDIE